MKAVLFFALERELTERNVMQRFRPFEGDEGKVRRDAFSESEVQAILGGARPNERARIGLLCFTGLRPGEAYALVGRTWTWWPGCARVVRSWDHRGGKFVEPKTKAGARVGPLSGWLVTELTAHRSLHRWHTATLRLLPFPSPRTSVIAPTGAALVGRKSDCRPGVPL
jgi:integrase